MYFSMELARVATFRSWQSPMNPLTLARCGFFYNGRGDEVECFQCNTRLSGWSEGDNPKEKHRQADCQLLNGSSIDSVPTDFSLPVPNKAKVKAKSPTVTDGANYLNVKLQPHDETSALNTILYQALSPAKKTEIIFSNDGCTIDQTQPDFSILLREAERRSTFHDWPSNANADPYALAKAGFFYTGTRDRVQCFRCKVVIGKWKPSDVPISEHKRHSPNCPFVCHLNSSNVNEDNCGIHSEQSAAQQHQTMIDSSLSQPPLIPERAIAVERTSPEQMPSTVGSFWIEPSKVKARMDTPTVRANLDMGHSRDRVTAVIETRLSTTGDDFPNAETLLKANLEEAVPSTVATGPLNRLARRADNNPVCASYPIGHDFQGPSTELTMTSTESYETLDTSHPRILSDLGIRMRTDNMEHATAVTSVIELMPSTADDGLMNEEIYGTISGAPIAQAMDN